MLINGIHIQISDFHRLVLQLWLVFEQALAGSFPLEPVGSSPLELGLEPVGSSPLAPGCISGMVSGLEHSCSFAGEPSCTSFHIHHILHDLQSRPPCSLLNTFVHKMFHKQLSTVVHS